MQTEYACLCMQVFIHMHINTIIFLPVNKFYVLHIYLNNLRDALCRKETELVLYLYKYVNILPCPCWIFLKSYNPSHCYNKLFTLFTLNLNVPLVER